MCGQKFCILCKKDSHTGISCLGNASNNPRIIDLPAPDDLLNPKNLEEREYLNAQMLFSNSVPDMTFLSAKLIINKNLEEKYVKKKAEIAATLSDPCGETYVWHGSS